MSKRARCLLPECFLDLWSAVQDLPIWPTPQLRQILSCNSIRYRWMFAINTVKPVDKNLVPVCYEIFTQP